MLLLSACDNHTVSKALTIRIEHPIPECNSNKCVASHIEDVHAALTVCNLKLEKIEQLSN